jgi:hypothetical protein
MKRVMPAITRWSVTCLQTSLLQAFGYSAASGQTGGGRRSHSTADMETRIRGPEVRAGFICFIPLLKWALSRLRKGDATESRSSSAEISARVAPHAGDERTRIALSTVQDDQLRITTNGMNTGSRPATQPDGTESCVNPVRGRRPTGAYCEQRGRSSKERPALPAAAYQSAPRVSRLPCR